VRIGGAERQIVFRGGIGDGGTPDRSVAMATSDERLAQIRARLAETTDQEYSMWDFGPAGCASGDAYFFGNAREDVAYLLAALSDAETRYTDLWDAFHEEQRLRNRRVDWHENDTRELLRSEYGIDAATTKPKN